MHAAFDFEAVSAGIEALNARVRRIAIHARPIEERLSGLMFANG